MNFITRTKVKYISLKIQLILTFFNVFLTETCIASQGIPCRQNQRCPIDEKNFLCNESLTYCVKSNYKCDGQNNCNSALTLDKTDEKNCEYNIISRKKSE